ncbi:MAG TPA: NosD domain-containing protein [Vicinamibacterales bacterium]|nr:NosD domain-containing protein [Vicinamibacterales bacterium]
MNRLPLLKHLVFPLLLSLSASSAAWAAPTVGTLFVGSDTVLTEDHHGPVVFTAGSVTLDCAGHTVRGAGNGVGVLITAPAVTVTVQNCAVTGFERAIQVVFTSGVAVRDNVTTANDYGIVIEFSSQVLVDGNSATNNTFAGFAIGQSRQLRLQGNTSNNNGRNGFETHSFSSDVEFVDNTANGNADHGFGESFTFANHYRGNTATNNGEFGFGFWNSVGNDIAGNVSNHNGIGGFLLQDSWSMSLRDGIAKNNLAGVLVTGTSFSLISGINGCPNSELDLYQDPTSSGNTFADNRVCRTAGID